MTIDLHKYEGLPSMLEEMSARSRSILQLFLRAYETAEPASLPLARTVQRRLRQDGEATLDAVELWSFFAALRFAADEGGDDRLAESADYWLAIVSPFLAPMERLETLDAAVLSRLCG